MSPTPLTDSLNDLISELDLNDDELKLVQFIALVGFYRATLETLIGLKGSDNAFVKSLNEFVDSSVKSLSQEERERYDKAMQTASKTLLDEIRKHTQK